MRLDRAGETPSMGESGPIFKSHLSAPSAEYACCSRFAFVVWLDSPAMCFDSNSNNMLPYSAG
ncbi:hypothetical protein I79_005383 [Cricetulus griseus]|uniref:Uncharacterized protein n=1 Tax=Cricetulus griseus TaxID=10029 RepID=G3H514_CRIGR|nr:hypothetical protein I79_005383 [Cricetulus griseus]